MKPISDVVQATPASGIRRFFDIVSQMHEVISLGVGEPDFDTPWRISEACIYSLERGKTHYTSNYGTPELRQAIADYWRTREGLEYNWENQVLITVGVSEAMDLAMRAILNPGDEVICPEPCYVSYKPCVAFAGGVPVPIPSTWKTSSGSHPSDQGRDYSKDQGHSDQLSLEPHGRDRQPRDAAADSRYRDRT